MSVNIYPAFIQGRLVSHVDDFDEDSTLNIANGNFYGLINTLGLNSVVTEVPGTMKIKTLEMALDTAPPTRYTERLKKICAIARIKRANVIAYS